MKKSFLFLFLILVTSAVYPQKVLDKIVAVVDNEIIMQSELEFQVNQFAYMRKVDPATPGLKDQVLNSMIEEKLAYAQANIDSLIISDEEVNQRIDYQIEYLKQQYGSREQIEKMYGMSIEKIKRELQDDVRKSLMIQRLQEKNFGFVDVSRREVEAFFRDYRDSIGVIPEKVTISHIYRNPRQNEALREKYRLKAQSILDSIKAGADFAELARTHSEDPGSAEQGGDLGFVKRGVFYPEFESAAFSMDQGQISEIVESPVGFHIIQLVEKRGESIHTKHILVKIKNDDQADFAVIDFLNDIRDSVLRKVNDFKYFARKYSEDKETSVFGGELGTFYLNQLDKNLLDIVTKLKQGEISYPRRIEFGADNYGYHIVYLQERVPQHTADLEKDYTEIKRLAEEYKKQRLYSRWIDSLKDKIYWEVRI
jgi:peptidyl-prolyl cis-trans isomerase SurA